MEMPNKLILAVIKKANSYNSWWYETIRMNTFENDEDFASSLKNVESYYSEQHHGAEVHAFEISKEDEYVHEGMSGCDCETYSLRAIYQVQVNEITENVVLELHESMYGSIGYDVIYELDSFPTLAGEDENFDLNSI